MDTAAERYAIHDGMSHNTSHNSHLAFGKVWMTVAEWTWRSHICMSGICGYCLAKLMLLLLQNKCFEARNQHTLDPYSAYE